MQINTHLKQITQYYLLKHPEHFPDDFQSLIKTT
jgi:hypothetical protein